MPCPAARVHLVCARCEPARAEGVASTRSRGHVIDVAHDPRSARPFDAITIVLGVGGALAAVGVVSLGLAVACRETAEAPAPPIVPGPIGAPVLFPDAGMDAHFDSPATAPPLVPYALDDYPRRPELAALGCPDVPLIDYVGEPIPWRPAFRVNPVFAPSVRALEALIVETSREVYGHAPTTLLSASGYRCTTVSGRPERISEHALGNAIDVRGIELDAETTTTVRDHWYPHAGDDPRHARFWRLLVVRARDRGLFRGIIGPPRADHLDHLHFDQSPSTFFDVSLE
jgi:hypothetical protein